MKTEFINLANEPRGPENGEYYTSNGFKLVESEIEDNEVISTYSNQDYTLEVSTQKREDDDWYNSSVTAYSITLIKKAGIYDPDNGTKTDYYYDGYSILAEYTLKNGQLHGPLKSYFKNGNIKKTGNYINGKESGLFKEYYEDGSISFEYYMKDGEMSGVFKAYYENGEMKKVGSLLNGIENGVFKEYNEEGLLSIEYTMRDGELNGAFKSYYENGHIKKSGSFLNGKEDGSFKEFTEYGDLEATYSKVNDEYNGLLTIYETGKVSKLITYNNGTRDGLFTEYTYGDNDTLLFEYSGLIKNELFNGVWTLYLYKGGKKEVAEFTTYENGVKEGKFKKIQGDSLIFGNYVDDKLDGDYVVYIDLTRFFLGGLINTDTSGLNKLCEGRFYTNMKSGDWKYYDLSGTLIKAGRYSSDKETGKWYYYYSKFDDGYGNLLPFSGELYLVESYDIGKKNGLSERFSSLEKVKYLCDTSIYSNVNPLDTCTRLVYYKEYQSFYYKYDLLHGPCVVKDSTGIVIFKGNYFYGKKDGLWLESYSSKDLEDNSFYIFEEGEYVKGERHGKWIEYADKDFVWQTSHYSKGKLNGDMVDYLKNGGIRETRKFEDDFLKELIVYDSTGSVIVSMYEILKESDYSLNVRRSEYINGGLTGSLEYYMKKDDPVLNYIFFELLFAIKTGDFSDNESGYPDGEFILYDEFGRVKIQGKLLKDDKVGVWKFNYPEQNVQVQIDYMNNEPFTEMYYSLSEGTLFSGVFKFSDNENNISEERKIKDGLRNGRTAYFDQSNGKLIKKEKYENGEIQ